MSQGKTELRTETPASVQTAKHTGTEEGRRKFDNPAKVLKGNDAGETQAVQGPANVPIEDLCWFVRKFFYEV